MNEIVDVTTIRELIDQLRQSLAGGVLVMTAGVIARRSPPAEGPRRYREVRTFNEDNDPYGEHDFGAVEVEGERLLWKIDYYDRSLSTGSPDPVDPSITTRVLTIMLAEEY